MSEDKVEYRYKQEKVRREFVVEDDTGKRLASGVMYEQGNVQVLWRADCGFTGEQYNNISLCFGILTGATVIRLTS